MGIVQVIIDDSTDKTITGQFTFDRDNGGILLLPGGTTFPTSPVAGEYFVRTDELKLYRRNDGDTAWETVGALSAHALGGSSHTADTLANLNTKISDGNLDFDTASRPPTSHTHGGGDITSAVTNAVDADTVDGEHASAFADASHTHTESDITDLDHDAQKIKGVTVDDTDIADGKILKYNSTSGNLEYEDDATGTPTSSEYFDAYDNAGGTDISSGWTDVPLDTERQKDSPYTHTGSSAEVTIGTTDTYVAVLRVTTYVSAGTARSDSECRIAVDAGSGYSPVSGTIGTMYNRQASQGTATATVVAILSLTSGDKIKGQAQLLSGANTINLLADGSSLTLMRLQGQKGDTGPAGSGTTLTMQDEGVSLPNTPHSTLNVTGSGASISDSGSGVATLNVPGAAAPPEESAVSFIEFIADFEMGWSGGVGGTGSYTFLTLLGGQLELASGVTSGGAAAVQQDNETLTVGGNFEFKGRIRLVESADLYIELGVSNDAGHYAVFSNDGTSDHWRTRTQGGGSETYTDDVDIPDTSWHIWDILCNGSQIVFKIDDSTVATHTTNLPSESMHAYVYMESTASGNKRCRIDYLKTTTDRET